MTLKDEILGLVKAYAREQHAPGPFVPGTTPVPVSGRVFGAEELSTLVEASLEFWLTAGHFNDSFEGGLAKYLGVRHALTASSGSSANLLAMACLCSPSLGERALRAGDEVITVAAGFPTTVNPALLYGLVPVFVDIDIPTYNVDPALIESALSEKTRAIVLAHTLGNPFAVDAVLSVARRHDLWVVEDCCDALGATYAGLERPLVTGAVATGEAEGPSGKDLARFKAGTFGHIGTLSFYPAHHITMGEGGAVFTNDDELRRIMESLRDWGRDCYCPPGRDNTCGKRFEWQLGDLPAGYDHKYVYSELGYNLKITDLQAAIGLVQLERLPGFIEQRRRNFRFMKEGLSGLSEFLVLPEATPGAEPSWFGFPVTLRKEADVFRGALLRYLDQRRIATRLLFGGNLTKQPYFKGRTYRVSGSLERTDRVMCDTFWLGVYPGLTTDMLDYVVSQLNGFFGVGW